MRKIKFILPLLASFGFILASCRIQGSVTPANQIVLSGAKTLNVGETLTLTAHFSEGKEDVEWSSSDSSVASVDASGTVKAVAAGEATITATSKSNNNIKASEVIKVNGVTDSTKVKITFVDYDGTVLETSEINKGETPSYGKENPVRVSDAKNSYVFLKWDKDLGPVNEDTTYTAVYEAIPLTDFVFGMDIVNGGYSVLSYKGTDTEINIPETFSYRKVVSIGKEAFSGNTTVTKVTLPSTIKAIGESAFANNTALESINLPDGLKALGQSAFSGDSALSSVLNLGDGITEIPDNCFKGCTVLMQVTGHKNLKTIGVGAFSNAQSLVFEFNEGIEKIGAFAFENNYALTEVTLPDSVVTLGEGIFVNNKNLTSLHLGSSLTTIEYLGTDGKTDGFQSLIFGAAVKTLTLSENNKNFKLDEGKVLYGADGKTLYFASSDIGDYKVLDTTTEIKGTAFYGSLGNSLTLPQSIVKIGNRAFGKSAFTSITFNTPEDVVIDLGSNIFEDDTKLQNVVLPKSLTELPNEIFKGSSALTSVTFSDKLTSIGNHAFDGATSLTSITLPETVTTIDYNAFADSGLTSIAIPSKVTELTTSLFSGAKNLSSITFKGNALTDIGTFVFQGTGFKTLTIPEGVTSVGGSSFQNMTNLESISLPSTYVSSSWEDYLFRYDEKLTTLTFGPSQDDGSYEFEFNSHSFDLDDKAINVVPLKTINFRGSEEMFKKVTFQDGIANKIKDGSIVVNYNYVDGK